MNLLLLEESQFLNENRASLSARQAKHLLDILKLKQGDKVQLGKVNEKIGSGVITHLHNDSGEIEILSLCQRSEEPLPLDILLGLPRPQMIKRILQTVSTMGVRNLHFIQSSRVEKSFWQSPVLSDDAIRHQLILGAEQGKVTYLPTIHFHKRFRPFMEDHLDEFTRNAKRLIAHPGDYPVCGQADATKKHVLAIGPEGGFLSKEVVSFIERGFEPVQLGARILKVETAIPVLIAKLF